MSITHTGHCLCGEVRYSFTGDPALVALCHCDDCQRQSGSAFSVNVVVPVANLTVEEGPLDVVETIATETGKKRERKFCGACGSPILTTLEEMPDLVAIKGGTLDDRSWIVPQLEAWRERAQGWVEIDESRGTFSRDLQLA